MLLHLLDAGKYEACIDDYDAIRNELGLFNPAMLGKEEIIVLSKCDLLDPDMVDDLRSQLEKKTGKKVFPISAPIGEGLTELQDELLKYIIPEEVPEVKTDERTIIDLRNEKDPNDFVITDEGDHQYRVSGTRIEQIVRMTPMKYPEAVDRVWDVMDKRRITQEIMKLVQQSLPDDDPRKNAGDTKNLWYTIDGKILIGNAVFHFRDYR